MKKVIHSGLIAIALVISGVAVASYPAGAVELTQAVRCNVAQARLTTRITKVDAIKATQAKVYTDIQTKVDGYVTSAKTAGYDTTALAKASADLKTTLDAYTTKADTLSKDLTAAKNLSCGTDNAPFVAAIVTTRTDLTSVRTATKDVRTSIQTLAIPALKDYATWLKTHTTTSTTTTTQGSK